MTMLGSDIPFQMFYTDNMYYMDMMGMKMKQEMPLDEALDQVASNLESVDMDLAMMKDMAMTTEDGNTVLTYGINTDNMNSFLNGIVGDMDTLYNGYTVSYNKDLKIPNWVSYELTRQETKGKEKRSDNFIADPLVKGTIATNADYARSGYDKGHMAPAADMKWSPEVMKESFYFSNMCPQHPQLNRRGWKNLEEKIRDWAIADSAIIIICGPIINQSSRTIGKNKVAVPERFFKVVLSPFVKPVRGIGFLFNNRQAVEPLSTYAVTIDSIEKLTNMDFFSPLPDEIENEVEANADYYQWPH